MQGNNTPEFGSNDPNNGPFNNGSVSSNGSSIEPASNFNDNPTPYSHNQFSNFPPAPEQVINAQANSANSKKSFSPFKKSTNNQGSEGINARLVTLSVALGVITLISVVVTIWLLVNGNKSTKVETPAQTTTSTTKQEQITAKTFGFYTNKITNPTQDVIYRLGVHRSNKDGNGVFGAYISTNNSSVDLYIYWQYIADYYGVTSENTERALANISFEKPVVDIIIGETGQHVGGDVLLFLLSDGTVEYMPVVKALQNQDFRSYGQLAGIKDVVKFYHVDAVSDTGDWSGYVTTLAQREDGSIVDLQSFMQATLL